MSGTVSESMQGRCWQFGDDILNDGGIMDFEMVRTGVFDPAILGRHCLESLRADFARDSVPGDIIVTGRNFGRGQLHDAGPFAVRARGVGLICVSMSRAFFRLAVSAGLVMIPFAPEIEGRINDGDKLDVNFRSGSIRNLTRNETIQTQPLPDFLWDFVAAGGEMNWLAKKYGTAAGDAHV